MTKKKEKKYNAMVLATYQLRSGKNITIDMSEFGLDDNSLKTKNEIRKECLDIMKTKFNKSKKFIYYNDCMIRKEDISEISTHVYIIPNKDYISPEEKAVGDMKKKIGWWPWLK